MYWDLGGVLSQQSHHVDFFSEKLNAAKQCYDVYDREFYVIVQSLASLDLASLFATKGVYSIL